MLTLRQPVQILNRAHGPPLFHSQGITAPVQQNLQRPMRHQEPAPLGGARCRRLPATILYSRGHHGRATVVDARMATAPAHSPSRGSPPPPVASALRLRPPRPSVCRVLAGVGHESPTSTWRTSRFRLVLRPRASDAFPPARRQPPAPRTPGTATCWWRRRRTTPCAFGSEEDWTAASWRASCAYVGRWMGRTADATGRACVCV